MGGARRHRHRSRSAQYGSAGESPVNAGGDWKSGNVLQMLKGGLHIVRRGSLTRPFLSSGGWLQGFSPRNEDQRQAPPVMPFYRKPIHYKDQQSDDAYLYGYGLLALCFFAFHFVLYTIIVAKWMPDTGIPVRLIASNPTFFIICVVSRLLEV